ncbi:MAG TPA: ABC transporter permease, partial [Bryobacteraceae bacterium]|nr:ABC transporter permease [Bryobacteraceae bacterium]
MGTLMQDLRYSLRIIRSTPGYTAAAVLVLALGIGANAAIFSMIDALVLRPLQLPRQERLVAVLETEPYQVGPWNELAPRTFRDWKSQSRSFELFAAGHTTDLNLSAGGPPEYVTGGRVSTEFFAVMGVQPVLGRFFTAEETADDPRPVAVLSHDLWRTRFHGDPLVIGRRIRINARDYTVVGVAPRAVVLPQAAQIWLPLELTASQRADRTSFTLYGFAVLKAGVTLQQANAEISAIAARIATEYPDTNTGRGGQVIPLRRFVAGITRNILLLQLGGVIFVLAIACANVANLQLAQSAARRKEIAMRLALGASGARLLRQLLTESVVLALTGAAVAVLFASWALDLIRTSMPVEVERFIPGWSTIGLDWRAFIFALGVALLCGVLTGIAPALRSRKPDLQATLRETQSAAPAGRRLRSILVLTEVALSVMLLSGAALILKGFFTLLELGEQHQPSALLTFRVNPPPARTPADEQRLRSLHTELQARIAGLPGVVAVSGTSFLPHNNRSMDQPFTIEGDAPRPSSQKPVARMQTVLPEYFSTMRIPMLEGRPVDVRDTRESERTIVISRSLARQYFRGREPVGYRIRFGSSQEWFRIVGVAGDVVHSWLDDKQFLPTVYRPLTQVAWRSMDYAIRAAGDPRALVPAVRAQVAALDPDLPMINVRTMDRVIYESFTGLR